MTLAEFPWLSNSETRSSLLSDVLGKLPPPSHVAESVVIAVCRRGVAALHALSEKIVHRDIKSFNFLGILSFLLPISLSCSDISLSGFSIQCKAC
jgi:hypothetical protein